MSAALPDRFAFSPADWQLTDACETFFFLQGTANRLNAAMDAAALAFKQGVKPEQLVANLRATAAAEQSDTGAMEPTTRDMLLQLLSRITGVDQRVLLDYWGANGFEALRARAAMVGVELCADQDDAGRPRYQCIKWAETASFANLAEVSAWLDRIDGGRA